jgi:hypothetical protein
MRRREFIKVLAGSAAAWPLAARAQQPERMRRIGVLMYLPADDAEGQARLAALCVGAAWGLAERFFVIQWVLGYFGINAPLPVDSVWLEIFSRQSVGTYLLITLKDGTIFRTAVTADSQFGSSGDSPDIYLGQTYRGKKWKPFVPSRGVYIRGSEIRTIEIGAPDE